MGACCTCQIIKGQKFDELPGENERSLEGEESVGHGDYGARIRLKGSSKFTSMFTQQGGKGVNQDAMIVWENFTGDRDAIFCGVFDGHGPSGHKVAHHICDRLPSKLSASIKQRHVNIRNDINGSSNDHADDLADNDDHRPLYSFVKASLIESFQTVDEDLEAEDYIDSYCSGSTAVCVLRKGKHLMIANLGDSRAILCTRGNRNQLVAVQLTVELKPSIPSECERITKCNGRVLAMEENPTVFRVWMPDQDCPGLAMARAFGDFCLKDYGLISVPEVFYRRLTEKDEFVVLASDGIWDVLSNDEVVGIVASSRKRSMAARLLVDRAVGAWKYKFPGAKVDDCAVICLFFKNQQPNLTKSMSEVTQLSLNYSELGSQFQPGTLATEDGLETVLDCNVSADSNPEAAAAAAATSTSHKDSSAYTHRTGLISTRRKPSRDYISVEN